MDGSGSPATVLQGEGGPLFPALLQAPQANGQAPAISGGASLGDALSCSPGGWKSDLAGAFLFRAPRTFAYQWQLDGSDIPGATTSSFTFTEPGDYTCRVTAANEAGSSSQTSAAFTVTLLDVVKYYDKNTNGQLDPSESTIAGWKVRVGSTAYSTPKSLKVDPGVYQVTEASPKQTNWRGTTAASVQVSAAAGDRTTVRFGNVCVGAGGAQGTGFWTNKNGQALFGSDDLASMVSLNLRNANGSTFDPSSYSAFKSWLQGSTSTNMAYDALGEPRSDEAERPEWQGQRQLADLRTGHRQCKRCRVRDGERPDERGERRARFARADDERQSVPGLPDRAQGRPVEREREQDVRSAGALLFQLLVDARSRLSRPTPISSG